jgi:hypothetical protein
MAEWSKAAVLKTVEVNASVGSNPTPSANKIASQFFVNISWYSERTNGIEWGIGFRPRLLITRLEKDPTDGLSKNILGEMAELAEGARLLSECGGNTPPRVRIPVSPPF